MKKGIVTNIQRYSLNDGDGIRTIVFLKGCPLRCKWCSNPETQKKEPQIMFQAIKCIGCLASEIPVKSIWICRLMWIMRNVLPVVNAQKNARQLR